MTAVAPQHMLRLGPIAGLGALVGAALLHAAWGLDLSSALHWLPECVFRSATGIPCPGCGMGRALLLLSQLRIADALAMHPAAPGLVLAAVWTASGAPLPNRRVGDFVATASASAITLWWLDRLLAS